MRPDQEAYIRAHRSKTVRELARHTGLAKADVRRVLADAPPEAPRPKPRTIAAGGAAVAMLVFAIYLPSLSAEFVWDDEFLIQNNPAIQSVSNIPVFFRRHLAYASGNRNSYYRPLQETTYALDYALWKLRPRGYHLTSVSIHAANSGLVYAALAALGLGAPAALAAAALFAAQPAHAQAVAYVAGRSDLLAALFLLTAFLFYEASSKKPSLVLAAAGSFLLALFSREASLTFPLALAAREALRRPAPDWKRCAIVAAALAPYALFRSRALLATADVTAGPGALPFPERMVQVSASLAGAARNLVFPAGLHLERPLETTAVTVAAGAAILVLAAVFAWRWHRTSPERTFLIAWFFALWIPISNLFPLHRAFADHWTYAASIGFYGAIAAIAASGKRTIRIAAGAAAVLVVAAFALAARERSRDWRDEISLFEDILRYEKKNSTVLLNLGNTYLERNRPEEAAKLYRRALELEPGMPEAWSNLGVLELRKGNMEEAEKSFKRASAGDPKQPNYRVNLSMLYRRKGRTAEAAEQVGEALRHEPGDLEATIEAGRVALDMGKTAEARTFFERARFLSPRDSRPAFFLREAAGEALQKEETAPGSVPYSSYKIETVYDESGAVVENRVEETS